MSAEVQCPAGCGPMDYKTKRNLKIRVFDPFGYAMMIAGIPFLAAPDNLPFDFFTSNLIVNTGIGVGLLLLGLPSCFIGYYGSAVQYLYWSHSRVQVHRPKTQGIFTWLVGEQSRVHSNSTFVFYGGK